MHTAIHRFVEDARAGRLPRVIARTTSGWAVLGDPQVLRGYCLLLPDPVVPHLNAMDSSARATFLRDMTLLGDAVLKATGALRINYEMLGNLEPALHAHIVPRFADEPELLRSKPVWSYDWGAAAKFDAERDAPLIQDIAVALGANPRADEGAHHHVESLAAAIKVFRSQKDLADRAIAQVRDADLHRSLDPETNSIAIIMKHMAGNMLSRWTDFLTADGEKTGRNRDDEFIDRFTSRAELHACWERGWTVLFNTMSSLGPDDLTRTVTIRGEPHLAVLAINRQLSHYGYHVGQIVQIARIHAKDRWTTLTIARGQSGPYNNRVWMSPPEGGV
jgi:diadenosine tetraphosphate (Ap4A) HIT family hydrolase